MSESFLGIRIETGVLTTKILNVVLLLGFSGLSTGLTFQNGTISLHHFLSVLLRCLNVIHCCPHDCVHMRMSEDAVLCEKGFLQEQWR